MKIAAITDIHGRTAWDDKARSVLRNSDIVVVAGDITDFGDADNARSIITALQNENMNILAIHGNCDQRDVNEMLSSMGIGIHGVSKEMNDNAFYGLGGSNVSPFDTPQEHKDEHIGTLLRDLQKIPNVRRHILVSHAPPFNTKVDRTFMGRHVGSQAVREYIETQIPDLVICGHIHEARGVDHIGNTLIINPGPFPGHFATICLDDKITYDLG